MDKNSCNALQYIHYSTQENNSQIQIRMRKSRHKKHMKYCAIAGIPAGKFYENAGALYMQLNPIDETIILVEKSSNQDKTRGFDDELQEMIVRDELDTLLSKLKQLTGPLHVSKKKDFLSVIRQYQKLNNPSDELQELMYEAKQYFEQ